MSEIDQKRVTELKEQQIGKFAGEQKTTVERHVVYAVTLDFTGPAPRTIIHSRDEVTAPSGAVVNGESLQTIALLDDQAPPHSKATARGVLTGELTTIGDLVENITGFSIDRVAERRALEIAEAEAKAAEQALQAAEEVSDAKGLDGEAIKTARG